MSCSYTSAYVLGTLGTLLACQGTWDSAIGGSKVSHTEGLSSV